VVCGFALVTSVNGLKTVVRLTQRTAQYSFLYSTIRFGVQLIDVVIPIFRGFTVAKIRFRYFTTPGIDPHGYHSRNGTTPGIDPHDLSRCQTKFNTN